MSKPLLEVNHLYKFFKTKSGMLHAVDDLSFVIEEGKTNSLSGRRGRRDGLFRWLRERFGVPIAHIIIMR